MRGFVILLFCVLLVCSGSVADPGNHANKTGPSANEAPQKNAKPNNSQKSDAQKHRVDSINQRKRAKQKPDANSAESRPNETGAGRNKAEKQKTGNQSANRNYAVESDSQGFLKLQDQQLVRLPIEQFERLQAEGLQFHDVTVLTQLNVVLVEMSSAEADQLNRYVEGQGQQLSQTEPNYLYQLQSDGSASTENKGWMPAEALPGVILPEQQKSLKIGMVDSDVALDHPLLSYSKIEHRSFVEDDLFQPRRHGTAIASIFVGHDNLSDFQGVVPQAQLFSASVFYDIPEVGTNASAKSIAVALDWLIQQRVHVINLSFAGPESPIIEALIQAAVSQGIPVLAAAGNGGPGAQPVYPAAYEDVVAVTAHNRSHQAYYLANQGDYIDLAAPGVGIIAVDTFGGLSAFSGTSYAVPFAAAAFGLAHKEGLAVNGSQRWRHWLVDLGQNGFDRIFGYGRLASLPVN